MCAPAFCQWRCALEVIDELLGARKGVSGEQMDALLELRWHVHQRREAEVALQLFCALRLEMEGGHYLAFFRIRRWLENHLVAAVRPAAGGALHFVPVKLDFYCAVAIRRACLCGALGQAAGWEAPVLEFRFRPLAPSGIPEAPTEGLAVLDC